jgi:hypothetical protein
MASDCHAPEVLATASTSADKPLCRGKGVNSGKNVVGEDEGGGISEAEQLRIASATGGGDFSHVQQLRIVSLTGDGGISEAEQYCIALSTGGGGISHALLMRNNFPSLQRLEVVEFLALLMRNNFASPRQLGVSEIC